MPARSAWAPVASTFPVMAQHARTVLHFYAEPLSGRTPAHAADRVERRGHGKGFGRAMRPVGSCVLCRRGRRLTGSLSRRATRRRARRA
jgi:hypothetical protein